MLIKATADYVIIRRTLCLAVWNPAVLLLPSNHEVGLLLLLWATDSNALHKLWLLIIRRCRQPIQYLLLKFLLAGRNSLGCASGCSGGARGVLLLLLKHGTHLLWLTALGCCREHWTHFTRLSGLRVANSTFTGGGLTPLIAARLLPTTASDFVLLMLLYARAVMLNRMRLVFHYHFIMSVLFHSKTLSLLLNLLHLSTGLVFQIINRLDFYLAWQGLLVDVWKIYVRCQFCRELWSHLRSSGGWHRWVAYH